MGQLTLITGGARSGKSDFAMRLVQEQEGRRVLFVATAEPLDADMAERIAVHRAERPRAWRTMEAPRRVAEQVKAAWAGEPWVILDCLTLLVSNLFHAAGDGARAEVMREIDAILDLAKRINAEFVVVTNEVGLGIVPDNDLARRYRDLLGLANRKMAEAAERVFLLVAGLPLEVKSLARKGP